MTHIRTPDPATTQQGLVHLPPPLLSAPPRPERCVFSVSPPQQTSLRRLPCINRGGVIFGFQHSLVCSLSWTYSSTPLGCMASFWGANLLLSHIPCQQHFFETVSEVLSVLSDVFFPFKCCVLRRCVAGTLPCHRNVPGTLPCYGQKEGRLQLTLL